MAREMTGVGVKPSSLLNNGLHFVGGQHLERGALGRPGHGMRVLTHVERAVGTTAAPVITNGLGDGQNMRFGERPLSGEPRCPLVPKLTSWLRIGQVRAALIIVTVPAGPDPPAALSGPACLQVGKLPCRPSCSPVLKLRHRAWFCLPDLGRILGNRSVAGEFA